jgi:GDP-D-mannose dehydratase
MVLGNLDITRDWGWAPDYVEAMWMMLQTPTADDYVIATGASYSLEQFVEKAFSPYGLDWKNTFRLINPFLGRLIFISVRQIHLKRKKN